MISIAYQTEFTNCKRLPSIYASDGGTACIRVRRAGTYEKLLNLHTKFENRDMPCCTL